MPAKRILIVEDEPAVSDVIAFGLSRRGFDVDKAADAKSAKASIADLYPNLALIDWMLPDISGLDLTRSIKRTPIICNLPVIMLTARSDEQDMIAGFEAGVEDYITKPFSVRELVARIHAVLRRAPPKEAAEVICADELVLDSVSQRVSVGDRIVQLAPTEYRLLSFFMANQERGVARPRLGAPHARREPLHRCPGVSFATGARRI